MVDAEKSERLLAAAVALLRAAPDRTLLTTVLNKALFYLDLMALRDRGETATDSAYVALDYGPVVAKYPQRLIEPLEALRWAKQSTAIGRQDKPVRLTLKDASEVIADDPWSVEATTRIAEWAATKSATEISDYSHGNEGWRIAYESGQKRGEPPRSINMLIAMQQIVSADPWTREPLDGNLREAVRVADQGKPRDW